MMEIPKKKCSKCKDVKEVFLFSRNLRASDGLASNCKDCQNKMRKNAEIEILRKNSLKPPKAWMYTARPRFSRKDGL